MNKSKNIFKVLILLLICISCQDNYNRLSGTKISHNEALCDLDTLVSTLKELHPDLFFACPESKFNWAYKDIRCNLPKDSITIIEFYKRVEPLTAILGDGHTQLYFPKDELKIGNGLMFPLSVDINTNDSTIHVKEDYASDGFTVKSGTRIIAINGKAYKDIINDMLVYCSGERPFFRLSKINRDFVYFLYMLYPSEAFDIRCEMEGTEKGYRIKAMPYNEVATTIPNAVKRLQPYSLHIPDTLQNTAIMEFNAFADIDQFKVFADSMFRVLKEKEIGNLIIDMRTNGGGDSNIGDELFQYISPVPFQQFEKEVIRFSDLLRKLASKSFSEKYATVPNGIETFKVGDSLISLRTNPLRYTGNVYLLISHTSFSSAGSFSWAFKKFNMGKIIGEESGGMSVCFGNIVIFRLPYSKIASTISFARMYEYEADDKHIHGTMPDVEIPAGEAMDYAIKQVKQSGNK